jgi:hypothetical protein
VKADLTRDSFNPLRHFERVLMQQGRVQLDADWNEQAAILLHYLRTLAADLIGPQGGPADNYGFGVTPLPLTPQVHNDFQIGLGRYYVDGVLCEAQSRAVGFVVSANNTSVIQVDKWTLDGIPFQSNQYVEVFDDVRIPNISPTFPPTVVQISGADQAHLSLTLQGAPTFGTPHAPKVRRIYTYLTQPDYPVPDAAKLASNSSYLIYLDVWERLITYVEDDAIREVALGGPDTAARAKVVWQVKAVPGTSNANAKIPCDGFQPTDPGFLATLAGAGRGRLKAMAKLTSASTDPCIIPPNASYTGPENQLYRVEIHRPGGAWDGTTTGQGQTGAATFKWSRENGSVVFPIVSLASGGGTSTVALETLGRDDRIGLAEGAWVEIQDDTSVLQNHADPMFQVQSIDRSSLNVTLSGASASGVGTDAKAHPLLRRWDYQESDPADGGLQLGSDNAALVVEGTGGAWLSLEDGVQIQFQPPDSGQPPTHYRTGDYWLIPARTATGDVEWPRETDQDVQGNTLIVPLARPPAGIDHHYARLAIISVAENGAVTTTSDCRKTFSPAART